METKTKGIYVMRIEWSKILDAIVTIVLMFTAIISLLQKGYIMERLKIIMFWIGVMICGSGMTAVGIVGIMIWTGLLVF